jgi:EKC/KEOPS complex subunit PCC1/LAGE3
VDAELSPLVHRTMSVAPLDGGLGGADLDSNDATDGTTELDQAGRFVLRTLYRATTNRMLRVAVNGFMESLGVVLGVIGELDVDVLEGAVSN